MKTKFMTISTNKSGNKNNDNKGQAWRQTR